MRITSRNDDVGCDSVFWKPSETRLTYPKDLPPRAIVFNSVDVEKRQPARARKLDLLPERGASRTPPQRDSRAHKLGKHHGVLMHPTPFDYRSDKQWTTEEWARDGVVRVTFVLL